MHSDYIQENNLTHTKWNRDACEMREWWFGFDTCMISTAGGMPRHRREQLQEISNNNEAKYMHDKRYAQFETARVKGEVKPRPLTEIE